MRKSVLASVILVAACGATVSPYARATAGRIGCPASQIELDQIEHDRHGPESWVAFCGSTGYACSSNAELGNPQLRIVCSELGHPMQSSDWRSARRRNYRTD
jgi:hypothetical protein